MGSIYFHSLREKIDFFVLFGELLARSHPVVLRDTEPGLLDAREGPRVGWFLSCKDQRVPGNLAHKKQGQCRKCGQLSQSPSAPYS